MLLNSPEQSRTELLLRRADLNDAIEVDRDRQTRRKKLGLVLVLTGVLAVVGGFTLDSKWFLYAVSAFQIPIFGLGFFLLAGQEVRRLKRELEAVDAELGPPPPVEGPAPEVDLHPVPNPGKERPDD